MIDFSTQAIPTPNPYLQAALDAAKRGWHVFPVVERTKVPQVRDPHGEATTDPEKIREWWAHWPDANIGVSTGKSGLLIDDCDTKVIDGQTGYSRQQSFLNGHQLFSCTPSGGYQFFFNAHPDIPKARRLGNIDLQAGESYVLIPPSRVVYTPDDLTRKGITDRNPGVPYDYTWGNLNGEVTDVPAELLALAQQSANTSYEQLDMPELLPEPPEVKTDHWPAYQQSFWQDGNHSGFPSRSEPVLSITGRLYKDELDDQQVLTALWFNLWCQLTALDHREQNEKKALKWLWGECLKGRVHRPDFSASPLSARDIEEAPALDWPQPLYPKEIKYEAAQLPYIVDKIDAFLLGAFSHSPVLFLRGGGFVRVAKIPPGTVHGITHKTEHLGIASVNLAHVREILSRYVDWKKFDGRKKDYVQIACPPDVAQTFYHRGTMGSQQRPLVSIIGAPTLRPDGSILDKPGYDPHTGLYLHTGDMSVDVPEQPTQEDAIAALRFLKQPFAEFPFPDEADRAVVLSAVLTGLVRPTLKSAPLFLFDAPKMGSGKTLLSRVVGYIVQGSPPANSSWAQDSEETEKRLFSALLAGTGIVVFDNVDVPMQSATLCTLITESLFRGRVLGESRQAELSTDVLWMATGNGLKVRGDLSTRVLQCSIDPRTEHPELRQFTVNLDAWVPRHRAELVTAGLTILRAYVVAGRPRSGQLDPPTWGRFEDWSSTVREALVWSGGADPMLTLGRIFADDEERSEVAEMYQLWHAALGEGWLKVRDIEPLLTKRMGEGNAFAQDLFTLLRDQCPGRGGSFDNQKLGSYLSKLARRIEGGFRLEKSEGTKPKWRVVMLKDDPSPGVEGEAPPPWE